MDSLIDLSPATLVAGLIFSTIGFFVLREGKKRPNFSWIWLGVALMLYPLFVTGVWVHWGVGLALCGLAYFYR
jgi:hypothetical protein